MIQLEKRNQDTVLLVDGKPFIMLAGEVHNSDSSSPTYMEGIWDIAEGLGMNTLLLPVTWEMVEPEQGTFDFSVPQKLIEQARAREMHIVFLWFGSWKNAECMYAPAWVKKDTETYKRAEIVKGQKKAGRRVSAQMPVQIPYYSLSYLCEATCKADAKAFAALMTFLKDFDEKEQTVLAVQVENETGLLGAAREVSDEADAAFAARVPQDFVDYMRAHTETMVDDVRASVENGAASGTWSEVFGENAEEIFSAYYVSSYVNAVAAAGKAIYPLPLAANCWLNKPDDTPGFYPSGGPVSRVHEVWDFCAPAIDVYCPDIYVSYFDDVCKEYVRRGNPLFIPESATHSYCAPRLVYTVGHYHAMCYSPFGFDDIGKPFTATQGYLFGMDVTDPALKTPQNFAEYGKLGSILKSMMPLLGDAYGTDRLQAVSAEASGAAKLAGLSMQEMMKLMMTGQVTQPVMHFGDVNVTARLTSPMQPRTDGVLLALKVADDELYLVGNACSIDLASANADAPNLDLLLVEEGTFKDNTWCPGRRFNGDETATFSFEAPGVYHVKYFTYK